MAAAPGAELRALRMAHHRLLRGCPNVSSTAGHMLAVQAQDLLAGRWALAIRTLGTPRRELIDQEFVPGGLVRSWTMRGTLHICQAKDLRWLLRLTRERSLRAAAGRQRELGIDPRAIDAAEKIVVQLLQEETVASRSRIFQVLEQHGIPVAGQRGIHLLSILSLDEVICQGPILDGKIIQQGFVLLDDWIEHSFEPEDPGAHLLERYLQGHGPATLKDAAWYTGQTLGFMRQAAQG